MRLPLTEWESFYVIVGSSAGALTGLQFVVIALGAASRMNAREAEIRAFATPTVVHFCAVLLVSAILSMPGHTLASLSFCVGACGIAGLAYAIRVVVHTRRQTRYAPVLSDWVWHIGLPFVAYVCLFIAGVNLWKQPAPALYVVAGTALLLLYIGIHNAWDAAVWMAMKQREPEAT